MFPVGSQALHVASFPSPSAAARCRATPAPSPASSRLASVRLGPARAGSVPARLVSNGPRLSDVAFESGARPGPGGRAGPHPIKGCFGSGPKRAAPGSGPAPGGERNRAPSRAPSRRTCVAASTLAPFLSSIFATSTWPFDAVTKRLVAPSCEGRQGGWRGRTDQSRAVLQGRHGAPAVGVKRGRARMGLSPSSLLFSPLPLFTHTSQ